MAAPQEYYEVTDHKNNSKFYIDASDYAIQDAVLKYIRQQPKATYVFRKMSVDEFNKTKAAGGFVADNMKNPRTGEKWFTESLDHTREFHNKVATGPDVTAEVKVDKQKYLSGTKEHSIPQQGSRVRQPAGEGRPFNITNTEHLENHPRGKVNVGLKGTDNVARFNESVLNVERINPNSLVNKNKVLTWIRRNKFAASFYAVGVVLDGVSLTLSIIEDGGKIGRSTAVNVSQILGGLAGAEVMTAAATAIAVACGVVLPGIGAFIAAFVGGLIGSLVSGGIMSFLLGVNKSIPGPGAPIPTVDLYPGVHGAPKMAFNPTTRGAPKPKYDPTSFGAPSLKVNPTVTGVPNAGFKTRQVNI